MENFKNYNEKFIRNDTYNYNPEIVNNLVEKINNCFQKDNDNFAELCYLFHELKITFDKKIMNSQIRGMTDEELMKIKHLCYGGVINSKEKFVYFEDIYKSFGFEKRTIERMLKIYERFIVFEKNGDVVAKPKIAFAGFSRSKLFELLPVSDSQLEKDLSSEKLKDSMTVKEIRDYVKSLKGEVKDNKVIEDASPEEFSEEDIPMAFNPDNEYDFNYFDSKSKNQLVNIAWDYQKAYRKLKEQITLKKTNKKAV